MALDSLHTFTFCVKPVGGSWVDLWPYVQRGSVSVVDAEGSEVDTLKIALENYDGSLAPTAWSECYLQVDGTSYLFYGYITKNRPTLSKSKEWLVYELTCEAQGTLLAAPSSGIGSSNAVRGTWIGVTAAALVTAAFAAAGVTGWDLTTYVDTGPTFTSFTANGENLAKTLDRICVTAGYLSSTTWSWRVEAEKKLRLGASSSTSAPFGIAALTAADWINTFPLSEAEVGWAEPEVQTNASGIVNQVTVSGGSSSGASEQVSASTTETFTGDGSTVLFRVAHIPIKDIQVITVGGVVQNRGIENYDTHPTYAVLVSYAGGTLRWATGSAPAAGATISITYRYIDMVTYTTTVTDAASVATYGQTFGATVTDPSITSQQQAEDIANAILEQYANGVIEGTFTVERYGLKAGQTISIVLPIWGLNGTYTIRRVTTEIDKAGTGVKASVRFGGRSMTLGRVIAGITGGTSGSVSGGAYQVPVTAQQEGEIGVVRVNQRIEFLDPLTTYVEP